MTRMVEVKRLTVQTAEDYRAALADVLDADARGDVVTVEDHAIVIRTAVYIRRSAA